VFRKQTFLSEQQNVAVPQHMSPTQLNWKHLPPKTEMFPHDVSFFSLSLAIIVKPGSYINRKHCCRNIVSCHVSGLAKLAGNKPNVLLPGSWKIKGHKCT